MRPPQLTRLANGMRIVSDRMEGVETASIGVWVNVGTRHEPAEINGVAHLLEHMAFKGTERRSAQRIAEEIETVGGHLNAYTSREQTAYYARVLKDDLPLAVDILADILQHSVFDAAELDRERGVIIQEIGQALDTPDDLIFDQFQELAYPDQGIGRSVLGAAEIIRTIPRERIASYMRRHYTPERLVVAAAGAVDHDALVRQVEALFTDLDTARDDGIEPARYVGGDHRERKKLEQVHLVLGFPGVSFDDPDYYPAQILSALLGGGMSSRLFQEIRERRGLVYSIYSFASSYLDAGLFGVYAGTGEKEIAELVPVLCDELANAMRALDEREIARARAQLKASLLMGMESSSTRAEQYATQLLIYGRLIDTAELVEALDRVDGDAVARVTRRILTASPSFAALGPTRRAPGFDEIRQRLAS